MMIIRCFCREFEAADNKSEFHISGLSLRLTGGLSARIISG